MFDYFFKIYISYICIDVILIFFVFILKADKRGVRSIVGADPGGGGGGGDSTRDPLKLEKI